MNTIKYETGATSHAVNDLILFTDNTRELAELRDKLYLEWMQKGNPYGHEWTLIDQFGKLLYKAIQLYRTQFPNDSDHVVIYQSRLHFEKAKEYCTLYANDFDNWKSEHGYK